MSTRLKKEKKLRAALTEQAEVKIEVRDLVEALGPELCVELVRNVVFEEELFRGVLEMVSGRRGYCWEEYPLGGWTFSRQRTAELRAELMERADDVVAHAFRAFVEGLNFERKMREKDREYARRLERQNRTLRGMIRRGQVEQARKFVEEYGTPDRPSWHSDLECEQADAEAVVERVRELTGGEFSLDLPGPRAEEEPQEEAAP